MLIGLVACAAVLSGAGPAVAAPAGPEVVVTAGGAVRGVVGEDHRVYRGLPYAEPPERWAAPRPPRSWTGVRDATRSGNACAQSAGFGAGSEHEDCLYLDVTAPRAGRGKPVVVWLHGGAFQFGAGADYDARRMAALGDVVVVAVNYRLGVFGFLAHPGLAGSGNYGLADQQAALRWVRRNAAAFGGDPGNVTIAGESSGARSVCAHLVAPGSQGLFHRAVVQSEPCTMTDWPAADGTAEAEPPGFPRSREDAERQGVRYAAAQGCADVACLRRKTPAQLLATAEWVAP
ncbi:MAG: carboxylesterase family protein, partial [Saccharothrix sp.]|nr:carboxylesterase family protein [Saccharothrix sp.]